MRLTLRTLLAYLDDILDPTQTREIGSKISQSGYASALIDRIRDVMRRRRLTAPELNGPGMGLDPNTVAEYLDNTLTPEAVADVEKVCLDSDVHLAEVAASHQILTLVLGEPVDVPPTTRERMYALGPRPKPAGSNGRPSAGKPDAILAGTASSQGQVVSPATQDGNPFEGGIPDYLRPAPAWKRFAPLAIGLLVGIAWLAVLFSDSSILGNKQRQSSTGSTETAMNEAASSSGITGEDSSSKPTVMVNEQTEPVDSATVSADTTPTATASKPLLADASSALDRKVTSPDLNRLPNVDPTPPDDKAATTTKPGVNTAVMPDKTSSVPAAPVTAAASATQLPAVPEPRTVASVTPANGKPTVKEAAPIPETPTKPADPPRVNLPAPEVIYTSRDGILARLDDRDWIAVPHRTQIRPGDRLAVPEPYSAQFDVRSEELSIELQGGTAVSFVGATEETPLHWNVARGRIVFQRLGGREPLTVGLSLGGEPVRLKLAVGDVVCGIELVPMEAAGFEAELPADERFTGALVVLKGRAEFVSNSTGPLPLEERSWLPLSLRDRKQMEASGTRPPLLTIPEWLDPERRVSATLKRYAARFEKELDLEEPLQDSLPTMVMSTIPALSELATGALAVTDQVDEVVQSLARAEFPESRDVAIVALRRWLPQSPDNKELLKASLAKYFPADHVEPAYRLLWGYTVEDGRNVATSRILVDWLKHDSVVIRQLAFLHVYRLTGQKYDYRPVNPAPQRKSAVDRWETHLQKHDGALLQ